MSLISWYKHKVFCNTEGKWVEAIKESQGSLTVCPNNNTHSIDADSSTIISHLSNNVVKIQEENLNADTNGFYAIRGRSFTVSGNDFYFDAFLPRIPFSILRGNFKSREDLEGDVIDAFVLPQSSNLVGYATQDINDGDTTIHVSMTVIAMIELAKFAQAQFKTPDGRETIKYHIVSFSPVDGTITLETPVNIEHDPPIFRAMEGIFVYTDSNITGVMTTPNGENQTWITIASPIFKEFYRGRYINLFCHNQCLSDMRIIVEQDTANQRVRLDQPFNISLTPSQAMPVYVQLSMKTVDNLELDGNNSISVGQGTIGGSYISPDVVLVLRYTRNKPTPARIRYNYEILY
jgi:hypothetical protein